MHVCIPILRDEGLASPTSGHFGNTPMFMVVDTGAGTLSVIANPDHHDEHGRCHPLNALEGTPIDTVVLRGIGGGALQQLAARGIRVYQAQLPTVQTCLDALTAGDLPGVSDTRACHPGDTHEHA